MPRIVEGVLQDLRYGVRSLRKSPGFTIAASLCLALGIGANTSIFSLVNAILLRPLPVANPGGLVQIYSRQEGAGGEEGGWGGNSYPDYLDARDRTDVFSGLAASFTTHLSLTKGGESERIAGALVTGNYFELLGVRARLGRTFLPEEDVVPGAHPVVVLGNAIWRDRFGADPAIVGQAITLNGRPFTVVGVTPQRFTGTEMDRVPDLFVPMAMQAAAMPGRDWLHTRGSSWLGVIGRIREGLTRTQAQAAIDLLFRGISEAHPETSRGRVATIRPAARFGPDDGAKILFILALLMAVAGLVLLVACANVANLVLARSSRRSREIAVRLSLGAGRGRLVRQLLTESLLLALLGGALAIVLALWSADLFHLLSIPPSIDLRLDVRVFGFALGAAVLTTLLFGLAPSLQATRSDLLSALRGEAARAGSARTRMRPALAVVQMGLSLVLLVTAGLFLRSVQKAQAIDPGFEADHVLTFALDPGLQGYGEDRGRGIYRDLIERLESRPGIASATIAAYVPLGSVWEGQGAIVEGREPASENDVPVVGYNAVGPGYFETLRMPLVRGRSFTRQDAPGVLPVALVNETMARRFWPDQDPIGKRIRLAGGKEAWMEIVGVARDSKYLKLTESPRPMMYLPFLQRYASRANVLVRTAGDPIAAVAAVRHEVAALDKSLPVFDVAPLSDLAVDAEERRATAALLAIFGGVGLLLAAVGLYGLVSYMVGGRTREIGIRMAIGATPRAVVGLVLRDGLRLIASGMILGLVLSAILTRLLSENLFGVTPTDAATFAGVSSLLAATTLLATWIPARRAMKVDPAMALRSE